MEQRQVFSNVLTVAWALTIVDTRKTSQFHASVSRQVQLYLYLFSQCAKTGRPIFTPTIVRICVTFTFMQKGKKTVAFHSAVSVSIYVWLTAYDFNKSTSDLVLMVIFPLRPNLHIF